MKYAQIATDNTSKATDMLYTYSFDETRLDVKTGSKVGITFGRGTKIHDGYVFGVKDHLDEKIRGLKSVISVDDSISLSEEMISTCSWMRSRYLCKYTDGLSCFLPPGKAPKRKITADAREPVEASDIRLSLTEEQLNAISQIEKAMDSGKRDIFLIQGVTGSGKTEVYIQAIKKCLEEGKRAIMMVPEISLTGQMIDRFEERFGSTQIAVLHSKLSRGRRYEEWLRIRSGEVNIVIGARSAVFAPVEDIGLIILDEEHESTYKSDMSPKYDTVEVAIKRAAFYEGVVLLGSATPSVVSRYRAEQGIYKYIRLEKRYNQMPMPHVKIVDMRQELRDGNRSMFSRAMAEGIKRTLDEGRQVILFLNRRGFSSFVSCRECGEVIRCPDCGISLTYHKRANSLVCHYCGHVQPVPDECPECGSRMIRYFGTGTEKLEEETAELFPDHRIVRLDLDSIQKKGSLNRILSDFRKGKTHILIGTQIVAKGLDFANVGFVGIMSADVTLNIPDFRSSERTFQLMTQAAGRAGRGDEPGYVVVQTYEPGSYAIRTAAAQDADKFYEKEIDFRRTLGYPPYSDMIQVLFTGRDESKVAEEARIWYEELVELMGASRAKNIYRPQPAALSRIKETYRYSMLLKCPQGQRGIFMGALDRVRSTRPPANKELTAIVDVNPYSFI